jgi:hypothetical protein
MEEQRAREKENAVREISRLYPALFNANGTWNAGNPLTQRIAQIYNSRPAFQADGFGLLAAAKIAFADYVQEVQPNMMKNEKKLKQQVKKLERATLTEGGGNGTPPVSKTNLQKVSEQFAKSGDEKTLRELVKLRFQAKGRL